MQRALMQFFKPENYFEVREALRQAGRTDLIGDGCDALIPSRPPREAVLKRRQDANQRFRGDYVHQINKGDKPPATEPSVNERPATDRLAKTSKKQRRERKTTGYRPDRRGTQ